MSDVPREVVRKLIHDLRTPVTVVGGFADLLVRNADTMSVEDQHNAHLRISEGAAELRKLLDDVDRETLQQH